MGEAGIAFAGIIAGLTLSSVPPADPDGPDTPSLPATERPGVSAADPQLRVRLRRAVAGGSLVAPHRGDRLSEVLIVDNDSVAHSDAPERVRRELEATTDVEIRILALGHNTGYAGGINRGVAVCRQEYVFLLNADAEVEPAALDLCATRLDTSPETCIGVVPKILLTVVSRLHRRCRQRSHRRRIGLQRRHRLSRHRPVRLTGALVRPVFRRCSSASGRLLGAGRRPARRDVLHVLRGRRLELACEPARVRLRHRAHGPRHPYPLGLRRRRTVPVQVPPDRAKPPPHGHEEPERQDDATRRPPASPRPPAEYRSMAARSARRSGSSFGYFRLLPEARAARREIQRRRVRSDIQVSRFAIGEEIFFDPLAYRPVRSLTEPRVRIRTESSCERQPRRRARRHDHLPACTGRGQARSLDHPATSRAAPSR